MFGAVKEKKKKLSVYILPIYAGFNNKWTNFNIIIDKEASLINGSFSLIYLYVDICMHLCISDLQEKIK